MLVTRNALKPITEQTDAVVHEWNLACMQAGISDGVKFDLGRCIENSAELPLVCGSLARAIGSLNSSI